MNRLYLCSGSCRASFEGLTEEKIPTGCLQPIFILQGRSSVRVGTSEHGVNCDFFGMQDELPLKLGFRQICYSFWE